MDKIRIAITMGDPSGIGPAIIVKSLSLLKLPVEYVVIGDEFVYNKAVLASGLRLPRYKFIDLNNVPRRNFSFGRVKAEYGKASLEYIDEALRLVGNHSVDCLVTCPVSKEAVSLSLRNFTGHTEYLARHCCVKSFAMMLLNQRIKITLVTRHIPLSQVAGAISKIDISESVRLSFLHLKKFFRIDTPRIIVCGLNPHASDNGLIGSQETRLIAPVIAQLKKRIPNLQGPISADIALKQAYAGDYDCAIAMYHDQALIALKLSGQYPGVNLTLGLPFVRTSPLHGTAFDIARKFKEPDPGSLMQAITVADRCAQNQKNI